MKIKSLNIFERGVHKSLGELEAKIMNALWKSQDPLSAREVTTCVSAKKSISFNAITSVLNRLEKKELVERIAHGKRYSFRPTMSKQAYSKLILSSGIRALFSDDTLLSAAGLSGSKKTGVLDAETQEAIAVLQSFLTSKDSDET